jgi:uncharacterized membrane protein (DUF2068 family)
VNQTIEQKSGVLVKVGSADASARAHHAPLGLQTVAVFEAAKGLIVLIAGLGLLSLVHRDAQIVAEEIVRLLHLNPAHRYPNIFIDFAGNLNDGRLWSMAFAALAYSTVRLVEAYGLWHERSWAEWFAVLSSGIFLPVELHHIIAKPNFLNVIIFLGNIGIVVYLAYVLATNSKHKKNSAAQ